MNEKRRNLLVALFVSLGLVFLGWLVLKFGDLPTIIHKVNSYEITIYFPKAFGIQENTEIYFCGYSIGHITAVEPPQLLGDLKQRQRKYYQVIVQAAIDTEYDIPENVIPKIYQRGLGSAYIQLELEGPPSPDLLRGITDPIQGKIAGGGEFISESTERRLDDLAESLTKLSRQLQTQLIPRTPGEVDHGDPNHQVQPNISTAVARLDTALKNLNIIIGDPDNQQNIKKGLRDFAALSDKGLETMEDVQTFTKDAQALVKQASEALAKVETKADQTGDDFSKAAERIQNAADEFARVMKHVDQILQKISAGQGTASRMLNDPRAFEALVDALGNLNLLIQEFREQLTLWKEHGILHKEK
jgi:phospholipid/cholesterol/gamma-HCH transport system substrate-binding protein